MVTEAAPGPEHRLMDGVRVEFQLAGQSGWRSPPDQTEKHRALPGSEVGIHRFEHHPGEIPCLGLEVGARVRRGKFLPELWREKRARAAPPRVLPQLGHHLEDDEPGGPRREPALATKVSDLADDEEQGVGCSLAGEVVEVGTGDAQVRGSLARLTPGSAKQDLMEFLAGSLVRGAGAGQPFDPLPIIDRAVHMVSCPGLGEVQVQVPGCTSDGGAHRLRLVARTGCRLGVPARVTTERSVDSIEWGFPNRPERFWAALRSAVHHNPRT